MTDTLLLRPLAAEPARRLRDFLSLLAAVRDLRDPLTSEQGLRAALEILARLAELLAIDPDWIQRLRLALANERVFRIVLAIVQYAASLIGEEGEPSAAALEADALSLDAQTFSHWLPLVLELLTLWRQLRGV